MLHTVHVVVDHLPRTGWVAFLPIVLSLGVLATAAASLFVSISAKQLARLQARYRIEEALDKPYVLRARHDIAAQYLADNTAFSIESDHMSSLRLVLTEHERIAQEALSRTGLTVDEVWESYADPIGAYWTAFEGQIAEERRNRGSSYCATVELLVAKLNKITLKWAKSSEGDEGWIASDGTIRMPDSTIKIVMAAEHARSAPATSSTQTSLNVSIVDEG